MAIINQVRAPPYESETPIKANAAPRNQHRAIANSRQVCNLASGTVQ